MKNIYKLSFTLALLVAMLTGAANMQAANYNLKICGVQVTDDNKGDLSGIPGVTAGTISYNSDTKTLTLQGVTMGTSGTVACIYTTIDGMIIDVNGNNTLTGNGWAPVSCDASNSLTIMGSGKLNISNAHKEQRAIYMRRGSLTIKDCTITASGGRNAINLGEWDSNAEITIDRANVTVSLNPDGDRHSTIVGFKKMNLVKSVISQPTDIAYNTAENKRTFCYLASGDIFKGEVKITPGASYDLWICGVRVTDGNKNNLSVIPGVTGEVVYLSADNTLILKDATITSPTEHGILTTMYGMAIKIFGNNTITVNSNSKYGINFDRKDVTIWSQTNGTLTVNAPSSKAIYVNQSTLTIKECTIKATGGQDGILGFYSRLVINTANVTATGTANGSIHGFNDITLLNECSLTSPDGAKITDGKITDANGNIIKTEVKISVPSYDIKICGVQVTAINRYSLNLIDGVTGYVNYNPDNKTLTLNGASMEVTGNVASIYTKIDGMIIDVIGVNTLKGNGWSPISCDGDNSCVIQGSGTLNLTNAKSNDGTIFMRNGSLTIKDCTLNATGGRDIIGNSSGKNSITFDNATVTASFNPNGTKEAVFRNFKNIIFINCLISEPVGAVFNAEKKTICDINGNIIKETVKIIPGIAYDLYICGVQVTSVNKDNLSVVSGTNGCTVSGSVTYNSDNKTLTLKNANISIPNGANAIKSAIEGLIVEVQNNNSVNSDGYATMRFEKSGTIKGGGTLNISQTSGGWALFMYGNSFTIENCTINATSNGRGITSNNDNITTLTINNATVTAKGNVDGSITHFADIILNGCAVTEPHGGGVSKGTETFYAVRDAAGNIIKETVKIIPGGTGLDEINTTVTFYPNPVQDILHIQAEETVTAVSIFNLQGKAVAEATGNVSEINLTHLPAGIYMVRMVLGKSISTARIIKK